MDANSLGKIDSESTWKMPKKGEAKPGHRIWTKYPYNCQIHISQKCLQWNRAFCFSCAIYISFFFLLFLLIQYMTNAIEDETCILCCSSKLLTNEDTQCSTILGMDWYHPRVVLEVWHSTSEGVSLILMNVQLYLMCLQYTLFVCPGIQVFSLSRDIPLIPACVRVRQRCVINV